MSILLENVVKSHPDADGSRLRILNIARYEVPAGEQVALLGPSGGGKTTLLNVISGISAPDKGVVRIGGIDIGGMTEARRDRFRALKVGFVFQTFNLLPAFTAIENVLLGMSFTGKSPDRKRAADLLERVGLSHRVHHKPGTMSVGEQQRLAVARALVKQPAVLLADEPTASVDLSNQEKVLNLLRETCRESNVTLLLVTHDQSVADRFSRIDRLLDFNKPE